MPRSVLPYSLFVVFGAVVLAALVSCLLLVFVGVPPAWGGADVVPQASRSGGLGSDLRVKLSRPITLEKGIDQNTPLKDALEFLADRYDLNIIVNGTAFNAIGVQKVEEQPVTLPRLRSEPLGSVLRMLVSQVRGDQYAGTYQIRDGHIEVTTTYHMFMSQDRWAVEGRLHMPAVSLEARGQAVDEALRELADHTAINIVLDARVRDRARKTRACDLYDVPLDTALQLLADQADLGVAIMDNVLYVTERENAREMQAEYRKRMKWVFERENAPAGAGIPGGLTLPGTAPSM